MTIQDLIKEGNAYPTSNGNPLLWRADLGIGYLKSNGYKYDEEYWEKYLNYDHNGIADKLTTFRLEFVLRNLDKLESVCDVGIGSGHFLRHAGCKGYDINPCARAWLIKNSLFGDPYAEKFSSLTFWDVLEHIDDPTILLARTSNVFVSIPIYEGVEECLASKHLRPDEHIWHFTRAGLIIFMKLQGFVLLDDSDGEMKIGREAIMTYCFKRL